MHGSNAEVKGVLTLCLAIIWCLLGWVLGLPIASVVCICVVGCISGILAFGLGAQSLKEEPVIVSHGEEAVMGALKALSSMETRYSICPYCHRHVGNHAEFCALRMAKESLVKSS